MNAMREMAMAAFGLGGEEPEVWVLGRSALADLESEKQHSANYQLPATPPGVAYERRFQGVPVVELRSGYHPERIELHSRDQMGMPVIRTVRY